MVATNVKVFDGVHEELVEGHVVVSGSKIVEVTETMPSTGDDVEVIDGDGRVLMPGLTDAHCHIMGMCHSLPAMMQGDIGWIYANTVAAAERTLMRGFTTVRDAGGADGADGADGAVVPAAASGGCRPASAWW